MGYIGLERLKKHLNIDSYFTDDDAYISSLEEAAEEVISKYINRSLSDLEDANHKIPVSVEHAILLWVGTEYSLRESVSSSNFSVIPHSFDLLADLYRKYN